jgi:sugar (pentulose or hexulose) kinase
MLIGLDLGTTSISAVLFDTERRLAVCSAECANNAGIAGLPEGSHEQCPVTLVAAACGLVASLVRQSGNAEGVGPACRSWPQANN